MVNGIAEPGVHMVVENLRVRVRKIKPALVQGQHNEGPVRLTLQGHLPLARNND